MMTTNLYKAQKTTPHMSNFNLIVHLDSSYNAITKKITFKITATEITTRKRTENSEEFREWNGFENPQHAAFIEVMSLAKKLGAKSRDTFTISSFSHARYGDVDRVPAYKQNVNAYQVGFEVMVNKSKPVY